ncbi:syntenin-1-like [Lineus longissimus]|uniref:syntenin-1-like n=1 Tax=Lineus longissimus TaxID=88925 RepID=UPI002B4F0590
MSLYPSLEDMKVDQMAQAQHRHNQAAIAQSQSQPQPGSYPSAPTAVGYPTQAYSQAPTSNVSIYPSLNDYMADMGFSAAEMQANLALVPTPSTQVGVHQTGKSQMLVSPVTGNDIGLRRAEVKDGVREVVTCKDPQGKVGLRVRSVNKGVFISFVFKGSPAAMSGLRFGDQILQINGETVAGYDTDKTMKIFKKCDAQRIVLAIRDRPFERTITLQKDSAGYVGFVFNDGRIKSIVKDSSAARNGLLIDHQLLEVGGQNVVGLKDKQIGEILTAQGRSVTLTIIPCFIYNQIMKSMGSSLKKDMDHSIPEC